MPRSTLSPAQILQEAYDEANQALRVSGTSGVVARASADVTAVNTVAETILATLAVPTTARAGDVLRLDFVGDLLNSSGGAVTFQFKVKLGATTIFDSAAMSFNSGGSRRHFVGFVRLLVVGTADVRSVWNFTVGSSTFNTGQPAGGAVIAARGTPATEDLTAGKNLTLTVTMGTAHASADAILHEAHLSLVKA